MSLPYNLTVSLHHSKSNVTLSFWEPPFLINDEDRSDKFSDATAHGQEGNQGEMIGLDDRFSVQAEYTFS